MWTKLTPILMKTTFAPFSLLFIASLFVGCEYFSTTTHTPAQIKQASAWSEEDQLPGFESCQDVPEEDRFLCFKNTISSAVNNALYEETLISNQQLEDEIVLKIGVDKEGVISLLEIDNTATVLDALPTLSTILEDAIDALPLAIPAKKSNVGIAVDTQLKLPIRITASEQ